MKQNKTKASTKKQKGETFRKCHLGAGELAFISSFYTIQ